MFKLISMLNFFLSTYPHVHFVAVEESKEKHFQTRGSGPPQFSNIENGNEMMVSMYIIKKNFIFDLFS